MATNQYGQTEWDADPETAAELRRLANQEKMAAAMMQRGQQPLTGGMVGQTYVGASPLQGISNLLHQYNAQKATQGAEEGYKALGESRRIMQENERNKIMEALAGRPEQPMGPPTPAGEMGVREAAPAGTKEQVMQALASSRLPAYRDAGLKGMIAASTATPEGFTLSADQVRFGPTGNVIARGESAAVKKPSPVQEYEYAQGQGYKGTYEQWKQANAKAGASSVQVNQKVEQKTGESMAKEVGGMLKDSKIAVTGAIKMNDAADRILKAIETGNVTAGPLSSKIQTMRQFFDRSGGDSNDKVRQTRQVIRALAESSVEARKELQGQGQVTENEALAVQKAYSGDIDSLTVGELQDIANLNKKLATIRAQGHQSMLDEASKGEGTKGLVNYYKVPGMEMLIQPAQAPTALSAQEQSELDQLRARFGKK